MEASTDSMRGLRSEGENKDLLIPDVVCGDLDSCARVEIPPLLLQEVGYLYAS